MIAEVAFDAPVGHPFSYHVPEGWTLLPGQRVVAPLRGAARTGVVVALSQGSSQQLKPVLRVVDPVPRLWPADFDLVRWISSESLTSFGSTCLALLPPPLPAGAEGSSRGPSVPPRPIGASPKPELLIGGGREARLLELIATANAPALVIAPDVEGAARWAQRLEKVARAVRLDSGIADAERARAWSELARDTVRLAVGTRSALLAPLPPGSVLALADEHEAAHRPPGPPRIHAREVILERAARHGLRAVLTAATPSVEMWHRGEQGLAGVSPFRPGPWPAITVADTRGIGRREALTPALVRAIREALSARQRIFIGVSRRTSALGCDECGLILRCERCVIALAYSPAGRALACRLCGARRPLPETCPACRGRRLAPFGWGAERVEHAVRRRFARAAIARYDPETTRGRRAEAQRAAALGAEIVIGTRGALRLFGPASLGLAAFVSPDQLLGFPDFRAAERTFALLWAAAERVRPDGHLIVQSQNPGHYALAALAQQDLGRFYGPELAFRAELGYPPFRRLARIVASAPDGPTAQRLAEAVASALRETRHLTVYPPVADRRNRTRFVVVKGDTDLPRVLEEGLAGLTRPGRTPDRAPRSRGIIDVEVDPIEWPS